MLEAVTAAGCAVAGHRAAAPVPAHHLPRGDRPLRRRSPRHAHRRSSSWTSPTCSRRASSARSAQAVDAGGIVKCLPVHDAAELSRGQIDRLEAFVKKELGGKGLAWVRVEADGGWQSPIAKFLSDAERAAITQRTRRAPGQPAASSRPTTAARANAILARLRVDLGAAARPRRRPRALGRALRGRLPALRARTRRARSPTCTSRSWRRSTRTCRCSRAIRAACAARTTTSC